MSDHRRRVVADTVTRVRGALAHHTTPNNLVCTVLAPAFLLPGEPEVTGMISADLEELGAVFELPTTHTYPSLFDDPDEASADLQFSKK